MADPERKNPKNETEPAARHENGFQIHISRDVARLLVLLALLYVLLTRFNDVGTFFGKIYAVVQPFAIGGLIALLLNPLMNAYVRLIVWIKGKIKLKPHYKADSVFALVLTFVTALLVIYFIAYSIIPQIAEAVVAIVKRLNALFPAQGGMGALTRASAGLEPEADKEV